MTTSSSKGKVSKRKLPGGGNSVKMWPTPSWQKGIQSFFSSQAKEQSSSSDTSENDESFEGPSGSGNTAEQCNQSLTDAPIDDTNSDIEE